MLMFIQNRRVDGVAWKMHPHNGHDKKYRPKAGTGWLWACLNLPLFDAETLEGWGK
jgi:hypothetical protein